MSCIDAKDFNNTSEELTLDPQDNNEIAVDANSNSNETEIQSEILSSQSPKTTESQAYLVLDNDADKENIYIGDSVTWIVSVINKGPDMAKNVKVYDQLPEGLKYLKHTTTKGTFNPKTGIWDIGNLSVEDGEVFLNILTKALTPGEKVNKATVTTDSVNLNENESFEEEEIDVFEKHAEISKSAYSQKQQTGNPLYLIVLSLCSIFITFLRKSP